MSAEMFQNIGRRLKSIYVVLIIMLVATTMITMIEAMPQSYVYQLNNGVLMAIFIVCSLAIIVCTIRFCSQLFALGLVFKGFELAGILIIVSSALTIVGNMKSGVTPILCSAGASIAMIVHKKYFIDGMKLCAQKVSDEDLVKKWKAYWVIFIVTQIVIILLGVSILFSDYYGAGGARIAISAILSLVIGAWMLTLIRESYETILRHASELENEEGKEEAKEDGEKVAKTLVTYEKPQNQEFRTKLYFVTWIIGILIFLTVLRIFAKVFLNYDTAGINRVSLFGSWGVLVAYAILLGMMKRYQTSFLVAGIVVALGVGINVLCIRFPYFITSISHSPFLNGQVDVIGGAVWVILYFIFISKAFASCIQGLDASLERMWVLFGWGAAIAMGVASIPQFIGQTNLVKRSFGLLFWFAHNGQMFSDVAYVALMVIMLILIRKSSSLLKTKEMQKNKEIETKE